MQHIIMTHPHFAREVIKSLELKTRFFESFDGKDSQVIFSSHESFLSKIIEISRGNGKKRIFYEINDFDSRIDYEIQEGKVIEEKLFVYPPGNPYPIFVIFNNSYQTAIQLNPSEIVEICGEECREDVEKRYENLVQMARSNPIIKGSSLYSYLDEEKYTFRPIEKIVGEECAQSVDLLINSIFS